jgi:hypothetical protein
MCLGILSNELQSPAFAFRLNLLSFSLVLVIKKVLVIFVLPPRSHIMHASTRLSTRSTRLARTRPTPATFRSPRLRPFSSTAATSKEIQETYILSAARTPTAKVRSWGSLLMHCHRFRSLMDAVFSLVQWLFRFSFRSPARRRRNQERNRKIWNP